MAVSATEIQLMQQENLLQSFIRIDRLTLRFPLYQGGMSKAVTRELMVRCPAAAILLLDPVTDAMVLIEQFRPGAWLAGFHPWQLECVAGMLDVDESPAELVQRETEEEANLQLLTPPIKVMEFSTSPGLSTECVHLFYARVDSTQAAGIHGLEEEGENIRVSVHPIAQAMELVDSGRMNNSIGIIALQWLALHYVQIKNQLLAHKRIE